MIRGACGSGMPSSTSVQGQQGCHAASSLAHSYPTWLIMIWEPAALETHHGRQCKASWAVMQPLART